MPEVKVTTNWPKVVVSVGLAVFSASVAANEVMCCEPLDATLVSRSLPVRLPLPSAVNAPVVTYQEPGAVCCPKNWKAYGPLMLESAKADVF